MQSTRPVPPVAEVIPRGALRVAGIVLVAIVVAVAAARLGGFDTHAPDAAPVAQRALRFLDRPDGGIAVVDAATGETLDVVQGEQGFLRGTLRGFARERRRLEQSAQQPLDLIARADGRLTLADPATGRRIDLESFGPTNAAVFARWLVPPTALRRETTP
ncbi:MAG: putative photosynthetic complex assembly protein PuhC [Burkholderiales bacterium]|nr:putative photosynthetic complex assembly protein PuhC [Burkholderiales bacterium]